MASVCCCREPDTHPLLPVRSNRVCQRQHLGAHASTTFFESHNGLLWLIGRLVCSLVSVRRSRLEPAAARGHQEEDDGRKEHEHHADVNDGVNGLVQPCVVGPTEPMAERKIAQWHRLCSRMELLSDDNSEVRRPHSFGHALIFPRCSCRTPIAYSSRANKIREGITSKYRILQRHCITYLGRKSCLTAAFW